MWILRISKWLSLLSFLFQHIDIEDSHKMLFSLLEFHKVCP